MSAARSRSLCLLVATLLVVAVSSGAYANNPLVILLSWDGVRHDYPDLGGVPALERIMKDGLRAERLVPGWPSTTFPGHVTLATGTWADTHGIVDNQFFDVARGEYSYSSDASWIAAEPLWIAAERQGVKAATFFWVGSETDWRGRGATYRVTPFDNTVGEATKVDRIFAWIDMPAAERPGLIMSYWHGTDTAGHDNGPDDPAVAQALRDQDGHLARLLAGIDQRNLWSTTTLIIVSDHGMTAVDSSFDLGGLLKDHGIRGRVAGGGAVSHVFLDDPAQAEAAVRLVQQQAGLKAFRRDALPAAMHLAHAGRTGDVVVLADPPISMGAVPWYRRTAFTALHTCCGFNLGMHGYDPAHPDMGAILLAIGRGVPAGARTGAVPQIDIAPTIARLLGIEPPSNSIGTAIPPIDTTRTQPDSPKGAD